jgi:hypothetical protein
MKLLTMEEGISTIQTCIWLVKARFIVSPVCP